MGNVNIPTEIQVQVDVTAARRGVRESIWTSQHVTGLMNPAEALAMAADLRAAAELVDQLAPPAALPEGTS